MHINQIRDFARCSIYYHFRYETQARRAKVVGIREEFEYAMTQVCSYIWLQTQNGQYPTPHRLKQAWGRIWAGQPTKEQILFYVTSWRDERKKLLQKGLEYGLKFLEYYKPNPGRPLLINRPYDVPFGKTRLQGSIDLVREVDGKLEMVMYNLENKPLQHFVKNDLVVTAAAWATRHILNRIPDRLIVHHLPTGDTFPTTRDEIDFTALQRTVANVEAAIASHQRIPALTSVCIGCPYLTACERKDWLRDREGG